MCSIQYTTRVCSVSETALLHLQHCMCCCLFCVTMQPYSNSNICSNCSTKVKIWNFTDIIAYINHLRFFLYFSVTLEQHGPNFWWLSLFHVMVLQYFANSYTFICSAITDTASVISIRYFLCITFCYFFSFSKQLFSIQCAASAQQTTHTIKKNQMVETCLSSRNTPCLAFWFFLLRYLCAKRWISVFFSFSSNSHNNSWKYFDGKRLWKLHLRTCHNIISHLLYGNFFLSILSKLSKCLFARFPSE